MSKSSISFFTVNLHKLQFLLLVFLTAFSACYQLPDQTKPPVDPNTAFNFYSQAQTQFLEGDYDGALKNIETAIHQNPLIAQFYHLQGDILDKKSLYYKALQAYQHTLTIRSNNPDIYEKMAMVSSKLEEFEQAIQFHKKALVQNPDKIELNLKIAENYYWLEFYSLALNFLDNYRKKAELGQEPKHFEYFRIMGNLSYKKNEYPRAKEFYETYFSRSEITKPIEAKALLHTYNELKEPDSVYDFLMKRARPVLSNGDIHFFRGLYYYQTNNEKDARVQMEMALQDKTSEVDVYLYLGKMYYNAGETQKALDLYKQYRTLGGKTIISDVL